MSKDWKQKNDEKKLDFLPFIASGIARNMAARRELDALYAGGGLQMERVDAAKARHYDRYYRQHDLETELYCQKAADFIYTSLQPDENGQNAEAAVKQLLQKGWPQMYDYVQDSGDEVAFEPFWQEFLQKADKAGSTELSNREKSLSEEFAILLYLVNLFEKTLNEQSLLFQGNFGACLREQQKMRGQEPPRSLDARQKALADTLWKSIQKRLGGIPVSLNEYFRLLKHPYPFYAYLFSQENFNGLPLAAIKAVIVSRQELREAIDAFAACLPKEEKVTPQLQEAALDFFARTLFIRSCAAEYKKLHDFSLKQIRREQARRDRVNPVDNS
jgi:hypothetical protein